MLTHWAQGGVPIGGSHVPPAWRYMAQSAAEGGRVLAPSPLPPATTAPLRYVRPPGINSSPGRGRWLMSHSHPPSSSDSLEVAYHPISPPLAFTMCLSCLVVIEQAVRAVAVSPQHFLPVDPSPCYLLHHATYSLGFTTSDR